MVLINLDQPAISTTEIDAAKRKLDSDRASALGVTSRSNATLCAAGRKHCVTWAELPNRINEFSGKARAETPRPVIHISAALDCTDGDVELLQSLIELYFEQQPGLIEQICDGVAQSDSELNEHGAHSVKDCMSVFAAEDTRQAPSFWKPLDENRTGPKRMRHGRI